ncbi:MAG: hypothetical protein ACOX3W_00615 [Christensenellaceae bacterium]|jgi:hypothetical protein
MKRIVAFLLVFLLTVGGCSSKSGITEISASPEPSNCVQNLLNILNEQKTEPFERAIPAFWEASSWLVGESISVMDDGSFKEVNENELWETSLVFCGYDVTVHVSSVDGETIVGTSLYADRTDKDVSFFKPLLKKLFANSPSDKYSQVDGDAITDWNDFYKAINSDTREFHFRGHKNVLIAGSTYSSSLWFYRSNSLALYFSKSLSE